MSPPTPPPLTPEFLPQSVWQKRAQSYRTEIEKFTGPIRARRSRQEKHPIYDFLYTYYSFSLGRLERWHPGVGVALEDDDSLDFSDRYYQRKNGRAWIDPSKLTGKGHLQLEWIHDLLTRTQARPPNLACHGLHEWAMVFSGGDVRHRELAPLRLPQQEVDALVKARPICCSHFDAFRFFAPDAASLNRLAPTLKTRLENEQPGCIHANMDLYKWAYKSSPWIPSELLARALLFAIEAREIDMRASPYDLSNYGYAAIEIETSAGRQEYEQRQYALYERGLSLRADLIRVLADVLN